MLDEMIANNYRIPEVFDHYEYAARVTSRRLSMSLSDSAKRRFAFIRRCKIYEHRASNVIKFYGVEPLAADY